MGQATFAFYNEQLQELGRTATGSQGGGYCSGVASVTGQQTTTTISGGLWRWGDGVVTDSSKPDGEWAELGEWIEFKNGSFYYRLDNEQIKDYFYSRTKLNTAKIIPGNRCSESIDRAAGKVFLYIPKEIVKKLFTPIKSSSSKLNFLTSKIHIALLKIYRNYDEKKRPFVDHMNGDGLFNFPANLRPVTPHQNAINSTKYKWSIPGVYFCKLQKLWRGRLYQNTKYFKEELDAIAFRRILLQEQIVSGHLEEHDLWAFDMRVQAALAYRRDNNIDAVGREFQAYASPTAPIDPSVAVTYSLPPLEPIRPRFNTLWYRPSMPAV